MKLYFFPIAPNPTRVRLYVAEKQAGGAALALDEVLVDVSRDQHRTPEHLARHPFGKLPVLELDDASHLTESQAIIEYLEELHPHPAMLGTRPEERARVRELDRIADLGGLIQIARLVHATNSPLGMEPNPVLAAAARESLETTLRVLDARLADGRPFLAGAAPSVADCTLAAGFQFARFARIELDAGEHLARWDRSYRARPEVKEVLVA